MGLRVYGNELSGVSRAQGCRDTNLVTPVGPLDRDGFKAEVDALEGKGRTPIGRSLLKAPGDLGPSGDRTVILVSDGGDNCAPPRAVPARPGRSPSAGVKLSISVVGPAGQRRASGASSSASPTRAAGPTSTPRTRRRSSASCSPPSRARSAATTPPGRRCRARRSREAAPMIGEGQYLDEIRPGETKHYAVDVGPGQKLFASAVADPAARAGRLRRVLRAADHAAGRGARTSRATCSTTTSSASTGTSSTSACAASRWRRRASRARSSRAAGRVQLQLETGDLEPEAVPVELGIQVLDPNEAAGQATEPGARRRRRRRRRPPTPSATPGARPTTTAAAPASRS